MRTPGGFGALPKEAPILQYESACKNYYLILDCHMNEALYPTIPPACLAKALPTSLAIYPGPQHTPGAHAPPPANHSSCLPGSSRQPCGVGAIIPPSQDRPKLPPYV